MILQKLNMKQSVKNEITSALKESGAEQSDIDLILDGDYTSFKNEKELVKAFGKNKNYKNILNGLADGYSVQELHRIGVKRIEVQNFLNMLEQNNLSVDNAKALNQYSNGSNMILAIKKGTSSKEEVKSSIDSEMFEKLKSRNVSESDMLDIYKFISTVDLKRPNYENYEIIKNKLESMKIHKNCCSIVCSTLSNMNKLNCIDETIKNLDDGLSKARMPESIKVYRAMKTNAKWQPEDCVGKNMVNNCYISTSLLYDSSFAKYDDYDTVMEIYIPKGTHGIDLTQFSDCDNIGQEVLLNSNEIFVIDSKKSVTDKNGRKKNILNGILLSKEKECYKGISNVKSKDFKKNCDEKNFQNENNTLPVASGKFSRFISKIRAAFLKNNIKQDLKYD